MSYYLHSKVFANETFVVRSKQNIKENRSINVTHNISNLLTLANTEWHRRFMRLDIWCSLEILSRSKRKFTRQSCTHQLQLQQQHQQKQQALDPRSEEPVGDGGGVSWVWGPELPPPPPAPPLRLLRILLSFSVDDGPREEILLIYQIYFWK